MESLQQKIEIEYETFKADMIKELPECIWEKSAQIYFYSNIYEYFLYNNDIPEYILESLKEHDDIIAECWQMYLKKEELSIFTWQDITDILELCVKKTEKKSFEDFQKAVCEEIMKLLKNVKIQPQTVTKNNSVDFQAITISEEGYSISPFIYLDMHYEDYLHGTKLEVIVGRIIEQYNQRRYRGNLNVEELCQWEKVKGKIICKLINREKNKELLKTIPYIEWYDLAIVFCIVLIEDETETATAMVNQNLCRIWNKSQEDLMEVAKENTITLFPPKRKSLRSLVEDMLGVKNMPYDNVKDEMIIITNSKMSNGAIVFLYPNVLSEVAEEMQSDLYILPSGVHETIAIPAPVIDKQEVLNIVNEMNEKAVLNTDFLSENIYFYNRKNHTLHIYSSDTCIDIADLEQTPLA